MKNNKLLYTNLFPEDENGREINIYKMSDVSPIGDNLLYPNVSFINRYGTTINPIDEKIMSLLSLGKNKVNPKISLPKKTDFVESTPVFFFIYNTDNYYHFIYDTLPYLISFFELKKNIPDLKILISSPNPQKKELYPFVSEFYQLLKIHDDLIFISEDTTYSQLYYSDSFTHGHDSNKSPRKEIYDFAEKIRTSIQSPNLDTPKKIYISRRTWKHNNLKNIGTNYTDRRIMINEDELVSELEKRGFVEVFTEELSIEDKISYFSNAEEIVGPIGGGLVNCIFCSNNPKLSVIVSPKFLDVNFRFTHSFVKTDTTFFTETSHVETTDFKRHMRVKCDEIVGEISKVDSDSLEINFLGVQVAGWNSENTFYKKSFDKKSCIKLDEGLNSEWKMDIKKFLDISYQYI